MIREATTSDAPQVAALLGELGYPSEVAAVARRLDALTSADAVLFAAAEQRAREWGCDLLEVSSGRR